MTPADFTQPDRRAELVKFHGCAVRAREDEGEYRGRLIARKSQISGWATRPGNQMMKNHLEHLFASRPAFVVGLSAQDEDIHTMLQEASQNLVRAWPASPPAVVFAEQQLHHHHKHVLRVTYGDSHAANMNPIRSSALLGAYAKPALLGLVLFTLADKLCTLAGCVSDLLVSDDELERVRGGIRALRDAVAASADVDPRTFIDAVVARMALTLSVFRYGKAPDLTRPEYQPISIAPICRALEDPDFPRAAFGRLAIAVALLGRGLNEGQWTLAIGASLHPDEGVIRVASRQGTSRVFSCEIRGRFPNSNWQGSWIPMMMMPWLFRPRRYDVPRLAHRIRGTDGRAKAALGVSILRKSVRPWVLQMSCLRPSGSRGRSDGAGA